MDALLILGGLLLIVFGLVWLVTLAFGSSLFWGLGSLFPPLTLLYVVRHWRTARKAASSACNCLPTGYANTGQAFWRECVGPCIRASSKGSTTVSRSSSAWLTATVTLSTSSSRSRQHSPEMREEPIF